MTVREVKLGGREEEREGGREGEREGRRKGGREEEREGEGGGRWRQGGMEEARGREVSEYVGRKGRWERILYHPC